jgi:hypothetical protein
MTAPSIQFVKHLLCAFLVPPLDVLLDPMHQMIKECTLKPLMKDVACKKLRYTRLPFR